MKNLPKGAEALLIALNTPALRGNIGIPVLVWGKPGEGKSSFLEGLAQPKFPVLTLIASIHDPTDFSGLPIIKNDKVHYAMPEWVDTFGAEGSGILFLDELTTAPPSVQAALLRVVLERKVGFHDLPSRVRIVAAANPPDLMTGGWELSPPLRNRFVHIQWELPASVYKEALINGYETAVLPDIPKEKHAAFLQEFKLLISAFLDRNPNLLSTSPDTDRFGFATPRSWDYAAALMASCGVLGLSPTQGNHESKVFLELLAGCVGDGVAVNFIGFLKNLKQPSPEKVLDGKLEVDLATLNESELFILFNGFRMYLKRDLANADFLRRSKNLIPLIEKVGELNKKDIIFPAIRFLAIEEHLIGRMIRLSQNDPTEKNRVAAFTSRFFSEKGFEEYVNLIG
jgi:hypothetical protein